MYYKNFIGTIFQHLSVLSILEHLLLLIEEVGLKLLESDTFYYVTKVLDVNPLPYLERKEHEVFHHRWFNIMLKLQCCRL